RRDPPRYAEHLGQWSKGGQGLVTVQHWLRHIQPLPVLRRVPALDQAARGLIPQPFTVTTLTEQLQRYGQWEGHASANRSQGLTDARAIVTHWLLDQGQPQGPNRTNLLNPLFRVAGVACARRPQMTCVLTLAGGYHAKPTRSTPRPPRLSSPAPPPKAPTPAASPK
ncbi:MAG: hypothetical protein Q6L19_01350, partial [Gloeomargarita sp. GMQP_bins_69]